jgi:hypothetical protein
MNIRNPRLAALLFGLTAAMASPAFAIPTGYVAVDTLDVLIGSGNGVHIQSAAYGGAGCLLGTVAISGVATTTLTVLFSQYEASFGPGVPIAENQSDCQIHLTLNIPAGVTDTTLTLEYRGYGELSAGLDSEWTAPVYLDGAPLPRTGGSNGPLLGDFVGTDTFRIQENLAVGETQTLDIDSQIRIFQAAAVPEPASLLLMTAGALLLRRRRGAG